MAIVRTGRLMVAVKRCCQGNWDNCPLKLGVEDKLSIKCCFIEYSNDFFLAIWFISVTGNAFQTGAILFSGSRWYNFTRL